MPAVCCCPACPLLPCLPAVCLSAACCPLACTRTCPLPPYTPPARPLPAPCPPPARPLPAKTQLRLQRDDLEQRRRAFRREVDTVETEKDRLTALAETIHERTAELVRTKQACERRQAEVVSKVREAQLLNAETAEARALQLQKEREFDRQETDIAHQRVTLAQVSTKCGPPARPPGVGSHLPLRAVNVL